MKYRDEDKIYSGFPIMLVNPMAVESEESEKITAAISDHLRALFSREIPPRPWAPQGRIQFVARISLTVIPEFGMPQEGPYARIAGEFEMPVIADEKKVANG